MNPLDLFLCASTSCIWSILKHPECLPALLSPLAERTCFSQPPRGAHLVVQCGLREDLAALAAGLRWGIAEVEL